MILDNEKVIDSPLVDVDLYTANSSSTAQDNESSVVSPDEEFLLNELTCLGEPFDLGPTARLQMQALLLPTLQSFRKIQSNEELTDRRSMALNLGAIAMGKNQLLRPKTLSRKSTYVVFKRELELLDTLLRDVVLGREEDLWGYRVSKSVYSALMHSLYRRLEASMNAFRLAGERPP